MGNKGRMFLLLGIIALLGFSLVMLSASVVGASPASDATKGKATYDKACAVCHGFEGKGGPIAPPLAKDIGYFKDVGLPVQALVGLLIQATKQRPPGAMMPVYNPGKVNDADVADIADYLFGIAPTPAAVIPPGNAQAGAAPYAANCASCHGAKGEGGAGPALAGMAAGLKAGGATAPVMHALVRLATRSGALPTMPTYAPDKLSDAQLADIGAFIWSIAPEGPPPGAAPAPTAPPPGAAPAPTGLPKTGGPDMPYALIAVVALLAVLGGVVLRSSTRKV